MKARKANAYTRKSKLLILAFFILILSCVCLGSSSNSAVKEPSLDSAAVTIAEVLPKNKSCVINSDGLVRDYVKLKNTGDSPVDLDGWGLSDRSYEIRFTFPSILLEPGESVFLFFSGKNHQDNGNELYANFSLASAGETLTLFSPDGAASDSVDIPPLNADEVYALVEGEWRIADASSYVMSAQLLSLSELCMSEVMTDNRTYAFGDDRIVCDYVELFNPGEAPVSLADYALSDEIDHPEKIIFPEDEEIPAKGTFLILFTDSPIAGDRMVSTNQIRLNAQGEKLILYRRSQQRVVDLAHTPALEADCSYSRREGSWTSSEVPTPCFENTSYGKSGIDSDLRSFNASGILISEVLTSNIQTSLPGVEGHYDYVEIYNANPAPVNLKGFPRIIRCPSSR